MYHTGEKKADNFWQRIFYSQLLIFIGIFFIILFSVGISKRVARKHQIDREIKQLQSEVDKLSSNGKDLNELLSYLNSDDFLEEEARTKLGLKKEGEQVVIIHNKPKEFQTDNKPNEIMPQKKNNPQKWYNYFFDF